jgi:catechol 2,3-dioxygenase-like lactoylglutathione lyase family enzyme
MTLDAAERGLSRPEGVHRFALVVGDLDRSVAWYVERFEFVLESRWEVEEAGLRFAQLRYGDVRFELMERDRAEPDLVADPGVWSEVLDAQGRPMPSGTFHSGELAAVVAELGAPEPSNPPRERRVHILRDPQGRRIELVEPRE